MALVSLLSACGAPKKSITGEQTGIDYDLLFAMPNLETRKYRTLLHWLPQGAEVSADEKIGDRRDFDNDTLTKVRWLEGSYPNFFLPGRTERYRDICKPL